MKQAAIYIRVSTEDQTEFSPDAQKRSLMEYASKNDMIVSNANVYIDEGISGRKAEKRPAFMRMIAEAKQKPRPFDVILIHKFDRFARNREDSIVYKSLLRRECGIQVISITEHLEDDKFSVILEAMLEAMAEYYSLNLADEVRKGMREKALRGEYQAKPPHGYDLSQDGILVINKDAGLVRDVFDMYINGCAGYAIARKFNDAGIKTLSGQKWTPLRINKMISNTTYKGYITWTPSKDEDPIVVKGNYDAIIDEETWNKANKLMESRKRTQVKSENIRTWATGILRCSSCGSPIVSGGGNALQCSWYQRGKCTVSHSLTIKKAERLIISEMDKIASSKTMKFASKRKEKKSYDKTIESSIKKAEMSIQRAREAYLNGVDSLETYKSTKSMLENEISILKSKMESIPKDSKSENRSINVRSIGDLLRNDSISVKEKATGIRSIVDRIIYSKENGSIDIIFRAI